MKLCEFLFWAIQQIFIFCRITSPPIPQLRDEVGANNRPIENAKRTGKNPVNKLRTRTFIERIRYAIFNDQSVVLFSVKKEDLSPLLPHLKTHKNIIT